MRNMFIFFYMASAKHPITHLTPLTPYKTALKQGKMDITQ